MRDPRDEQYARILVETCIDVQPGWQVIVLSGPLGGPLFAEVARAIARRGAYVLPRPFFPLGPVPTEWINEASDDMLKKMAPIEEHAGLNADAFVAIVSPENTREASAVDPRRLQLLAGEQRCP